MIFFNEFIVQKSSKEMNNKNKINTLSQVKVSYILLYIQHSDMMRYNTYVVRKNNLIIYFNKLIAQKSSINLFGMKNK